MAHVVRSFLVLLGIGVSCFGDETPRILIVGDSWAASIAAENRDGISVPGVFDRVLEAHGFGAYETRGERTAWGGRKASDWAEPAHLSEIRRALEGEPTIDFVHLIVGGNDLLKALIDGDLPGQSDAAREAFFAGVVADIRTIVEACLEVRGDIKVVIAGYDYLDFGRAQEVLDIDLGDATTGEINRMLRAMGDRKARLAGEIDRCYYVDNWGTLQHWFADGGEPVALPGDPALGMPASVTGDGIHPDARGHTKLLENAMRQFYADWLASEDPH